MLAGVPQAWVAVMVTDWGSQSVRSTLTAPFPPVVGLMGLPDMGAVKVADPVAVMVKVCTEDRLLPKAS